MSRDPPPLFLFLRKKLPDFNGLLFFFLARSSWQLPCNTFQRKQGVRLGSESGAGTIIVRFQEAIMTHSSIHKVLIVDDNEVFSHSVERHLNREGFEVFAAHEANAAKSMVLAAESDGQPFDLIVVEFFMTNMQGIDLVRWLHQYFPGVSVLMVSGFGNIDLMNKIIRPDMDASLKKPVVPMQIMLTIKMIAVKRQHAVMTGTMPQQGMMGVDRHS